MKNLSALARHLETLPGIARDQMEAFADLGRLAPSGRDLGYGFEVGRFRYDAVIEIDRCPAAIASLLLTSLMVWLGENDPDRDELGLADPDVDVTLEDEQTVHVQVTVEFDEALTIVEAEDGQIKWDGRTWAVDDAPVYVAEELVRIEKG